MTLQADTWENHLLAMAYAPHLELSAPGTGAHPGAKEFGAADPSTLRSAYALCESITREHSATFYMASALLPAEQRRAIRALYAFCRISDNLVDKPEVALGSGVPSAVEPSLLSSSARLDGWRLRLLSEYQSAGQKSAPSGDDLVASAWADTRARFNIPRPYAEQLLDGVARDLAVNRYWTFSELADYCYGVASTVGLMSMHIVGFTDDRAIPYAVKLGVALQLTNILRDVAEDWKNGRLYLPLEELAAFSLSEADIADRVRPRRPQRSDAVGAVGDRWQAFMAFQIARARRLYAEAMPGVALLDRRGRIAVTAAADLYRAILDDIESHRYDVFSRRAHVSNRRKALRFPTIWWQSYKVTGG